MNPESLINELRAKLSRIDQNIGRLQHDQKQIIRNQSVVVEWCKKISKTRSLHE